MHPVRLAFRSVALAAPIIFALAGGPTSAQELPPEIQMDRYMVQADRQIGNEQYMAALRTLDRIVELREEHDLELPESFWMTRAAAGLGSEDYLEAIASATRYLQVAGRDGGQYTAALELLDEAVARGCTPERMTETLESVQACLAAGADPNGAGEDGRTILDWAAGREDPGITAALFAAGADPAVAAATARETVMEPGTVFRDCAECPEMVVVPAGSFMMGSLESSQEAYSNEMPHHMVTIESPFAVGVYEVTFAEWDACVNAGGCRGHAPDDAGWGRGRQPVISVNWDDAKAYTAWVSRETGETYRLLSEAEWEYTARAGTEAERYWGDDASEQCSYANGYDHTAYGEWDATFDPVDCADSSVHTAPVGSHRANAWGLYDVLGNVWEWTEDCWNPDYSGAPTDGSARGTGDCSRRVLRGGSWNDAQWLLRSRIRGSPSADRRSSVSGFRVARTMH